jgi:nucleotide-binding universal stress UspA family protein
MRATVGPAADSIVSAGARWPADLIVVGAGGTGVGGQLIGSDTTVKIATNASAPVLAVPSGASQLPTHAVVAIDFSGASIAAATIAASMLGSNGLVTLAHPMPPDSNQVEALEQLQAIRDRLHRRTRRRVDCTVRSGPVMGSLIGIATDRSADLIVIAGHNTPLIDRFFTHGVRSPAPACSVLVVKP